MIDWRSLKVVKFATILAFAMLFCCSLSILIIYFDKTDFSQIDEKSNRYYKGSSVVSFLIKATLVFAGIFASYKHLLSVIVLVAILVLLHLVKNSIELDFYERKTYDGWDAMCAETVAYGLCFVFSCTLGFLIKRSRF